MRRLLAIALLFGLVTTTASADIDANITGQWTFTARIQFGCTFSGTASLRPAGGDKYAGELTARQSCTGLEQDFLVRQDCDATRLGNQVSVRCQIVEFINGFESASYYPDNFTLTVASANRMHGALVSSGAAKPAEWKRAEGGIS